MQWRCVAVLRSYEEVCPSLCVRTIRQLATDSQQTRKHNTSLRLTWSTQTVTTRMSYNLELSSSPASFCTATLTPIVLQTVLSVDVLCGEEIHVRVMSGKYSSVNGTSAHIITAHCVPVCGEWRRRRYMWAHPHTSSQHTVYLCVGGGGGNDTHEHICTHHHSTLCTCSIFMATSQTVSTSLRNSVFPWLPVLLEVAAKTSGI